METEHGFLLKTRGEDICQLGTNDNPPEINIYKHIRMNGKRITNYSKLPRFPHEVANKLYVGQNPRKILNGYLPTLKSKTEGRRANSKSGFIVSASSEYSRQFRAENVFNNIYTFGRGDRAGWEWSTNGETTNFWIQIKCPDMVRVCKVRLRGRESNTQRIFSWRIEASIDGQTFTVLYEAPVPTYLGNEIQDFSIDTQNRYNYYRLFCLEGEETNPGLSFMQLFKYSE